jgi:uncharacterized protein YpmS
MTKHLLLVLRKQTTIGELEKRRMGREAEVFIYFHPKTKNNDQVNFAFVFKFSVF